MPGNPTVKLEVGVNAHLTERFAQRDRLVNHGEVSPPPVDITDRAVNPRLGMDRGRPIAPALAYQTALVVGIGHRWAVVKKQVAPGDEQRVAAIIPLYLLIQILRQLLRNNLIRIDHQHPLVFG